MKLSRNNLKSITPLGAPVPNKRLFALPEKVLQFGEGVLSRGVADYFIDKANNKGIFNGRIVVVNNTPYGDNSTFEKWQSENAEIVVYSILSEPMLWQGDLTSLPGFAEAVTYWVQALQQGDILKAINEKRTVNNLV